MAVHKVGVVGCGVMGSGIVQVCAQHDYPVIVSDVSQLLIDKGMRSIKMSLDKNVESGNLTPEKRGHILSRIKGTTSLSDLKECDLVIEAAVEDMSIKKKIFNELDKACPRDTVLTTNTSCLSVTDLAMATGRPDKIAGLHFFNPAPVMTLVEVVPTLLTSLETLEIARDFGQSVGKTVVQAKDTPGFIVNRLLISFILNAIRLLESGVASRADIDTAIKLGLNHPLGPLALADLIGLDVIYSIANNVYKELKDPQYVPPVMLKKMVASGWLGRKSKKGFYDY
jgi:3-hydroxybutyryl-CoA dehydrogenase